VKIIVSHDVDHITVWEHKYDLIVPKFICRSFIEAALRSISISEIRNRFNDLLKNKWQNLEEIAQFDKENDVPSTFFIGVNNGVGLSYSPRSAEYWMKIILNKGFDVGIHGISFADYDGIRSEYEMFKSLSGLQKFGIRMHYLRNAANTVVALSQAGYMFDSTLYKFENPFKTGNMWEFPLHIMDGYLFYKNSRWQNQTLEQAKDQTKQAVEKAEKGNLNYLTILFHDRYFSKGFETWKEWYIWVIGYLRDNGFKFINYKNAVLELDKQAEV
jgi:hypothetical protein